MQFDNQIKNRVKRIEGQVRGILRMMDEGQECNEVVTQMAAVRNALDKTIAVVVSSNLESCVREQLNNGKATESVIDEAVHLLVKSH